jgi:hypothetical protein
MFGDPDLAALDEPMEARSERLDRRIPWPYNPFNKVTEIHSKEQNQLHR